VKSYGALFEVVIDPEDAVALAASISKVLDSMERREFMGRMARQRALSLSWSNTAEAYLQTYEAMAGRPAESIHTP
jgi:glycosyltransferase involved in cell wall biosynthesis